MRSLRRLVVVAVTIVALTFLVPSVSAVEPVIVSMVGCSFDSEGTVTVPAGAEIDIVPGWGTRTLGQEVAFLQSVTTEATIDGNPIVGSFGAPFGWAATGWTVYWEYPTVAPAAGESAVVTVEWTLRFPVNDGLSGRYVGQLGALACTIVGDDA